MVFSPFLPQPLAQRSLLQSQGCCIDEREREREETVLPPAPQYPAPSQSHLGCPCRESLSSEPLRVTETWVLSLGFPETAPWATQGVTLAGPLSFCVEVTPAAPYHSHWERLCRKEGCVTQGLRLLSGGSPLGLRGKECDAPSLLRVG